VTRRLAVAMLAPVRWAPPGRDPHDWRLALAEDLLDLFGRMAEAEAAPTKFMILNDLMNFTIVSALLVPYHPGGGYGSWACLDSAFRRPYPT
jgi:hypothetical protein